MPAKTAARPSAGFTLMELLMTLVILAILLAGAVPAFMTFLANNRLDAQANEIVAASQLARAEAIKRGVAVTICSSDDGATCGGGYGDGWIVIADEGGPDELLVQTWPSPAGDFQFTPAGGRVDFRPSGCADTNLDGECQPGDPQVALQMVLDECSNDAARSIEIELTGRVASRRVACPT